MSLRLLLFACLFLFVPTLVDAKPDTLFPVTVVLDHPLCEGDTVLVNGNPYFVGNHVGVEVIKNGAVSGSDSIIQIALVPVASPFFILLDTLCPDGFYVINGVRYDKKNPNGLETIPNGSALGCDSLVLVELFFRELSLYIGEDRTAVLGDQLCVDAFFGLQPMDYEWTPPPPCNAPDCTNFCTPASALGTYQYALSATDVHGCRLQDTVTIQVTDDSRVYIPNIFSPGADEPNGRFHISTDQSIATIRQFWIADRWGNLLYQTNDVLPNDPDSGWDGTYAGKTLDAGVYFYFAQLERINGSVLTRSGTVTIVR
ncbi:MAG: gliding motility-associated C-terminal domain-containing protein [Saprospiraceae bacterium]